MFSQNLHTDKISSRRVSGKWQSRSDIIIKLLEYMGGMDGRLRKAIEIATKSHRNKVDKIGKPQICHPLSVMDSVDEMDEKIVAILHDVVEDTPTTLKDLKKFDFGDDVIESIDAISRREGEQYFDYIGRLSENELATKVKIADLLDNINRKHSNPEEKESLMKRYKKALRILTKIEDKYWRRD